MLLRSRSTSAPGPDDRVRSVLAQRPAGWTPAPPADEPGAGSAAAQPTGDGGPQRDGDVGTVVDAGAVDAGPVDAGLVDPGPDAARAGHAASDARGPDVSWQPRPEPVGHRSDRWLPAGLARARYDVGRGGAVALVVAALLAAVITGAFVLGNRPTEVVAPAVVASGRPLPGVSAPPSASAAPTQVVVAVAGEVARPGVVRLPAGSRVDDAVRAAGGVLPGEDLGLLNLARPLVDGEQVLVGVDPPPGAPPGAPSGGPAGASSGGPPGAPAGGGPAAGGAVPGAATADGRVDLNAATLADLDGLPGIGPVLAQRILDWRTEHGRFASVEQLREVTGIGESKYADLQSAVVVG